MTISEMLLPEFDQEMTNTRALLECVPDDKFAWKPHEKSMTMGRLASHVAEMPTWAVYTISQDKLELTPDMKPFNASTKKELIEPRSARISHLRARLSLAQAMRIWARPRSLIYGGKPVMTMPRAAVLRTMVMSHIDPSPGAVERLSAAE